MRIKLASLCLLLLSFSSTAHNDYHVGVISSEDILLNFETFAPHQNDVTFTDEQLSALSQYTTPTEIRVFFGQWCHDSQREVPRLIKLFEQLGNQNLSVVYYGLDTDKSDPAGKAKLNDIKRTPTVIVLQDGAEVGRILEFPTNDWATDIATLLKL
ncbi:thioredoxin family protein [Psychrosphaera sp. 1_MG-2023]|uniref:TlpA family protein disulfide reductase n=1 Tax=Psychrosphaera sp. 1_MG-2023 TaxID=3062643 RepID=UPI0026E1BE00|nr:thioredoxin family protein [Psychrosphaera sp. 1_MG-2023]MDO6719229.1 thioredoxin family protein [Psychrosphaera sp. 1_MG-2023]